MSTFKFDLCAQLRLVASPQNKKFIPNDRNQSTESWVKSLLVAVYRRNVTRFIKQVAPEGSSLDALNKKIQYVETAELDNIIKMIEAINNGDYQTGYGLVENKNSVLIQVGDAPITQIIPTVEIKQMLDLAHLYKKSCKLDAMASIAVNTYTNKNRNDSSKKTKVDTLIHRLSTTPVATWVGENGVLTQETKKTNENKSSLSNLTTSAYVSDVLDPIRKFVVENDLATDIFCTVAEFVANASKTLAHHKEREKTYNDLTTYHETMDERYQHLKQLEVFQDSEIFNLPVQPVLDVDLSTGTTPEFELEFVRLSYSNLVDHREIWANLASIGQALENDQRRQYIEKLTQKYKEGALKWNELSEFFGWITADEFLSLLNAREIKPDDVEGLTRFIFNDSYSGNMRTDFRSFKQTNPTVYSDVMVKIREQMQSDEQRILQSKERFIAEVQEGAEDRLKNLWERFLSTAPVFGDEHFTIIMEGVRQLILAQKNSHECMRQLQDANKLAYNLLVDNMRDLAKSNQNDFENFLHAVSEVRDLNDRVKDVLEIIKNNTYTPKYLYYLRQHHKNIYDALIVNVKQLLSNGGMNWDEVLNLAESMTDDDFEPMIDSLRQYIQRQAEDSDARLTQLKNKNVEVYDALVDSIQRLLAKWPLDDDALKLAAILPVNNFAKIATGLREIILAEDSDARLTQLKNKNVEVYNALVDSIQRLLAKWPLDDDALKLAAILPVNDFKKIATGLCEIILAEDSDARLTQLNDKNIAAYTKFLENTKQLLVNGTMSWKNARPFSSRLTASDVKEIVVARWATALPKERDNICKFILERPDSTQCVGELKQERFYGDILNHMVQLVVRDEIAIASLQTIFSGDVDKVVTAMLESIQSSSKEKHQYLERFLSGSTFKDGLIQKLDSVYNGSRLHSSSSFEGKDEQRKEHKNKQIQAKFVNIQLLKSDYDTCSDDQKSKKSAKLHEEMRSLCQIVRKHRRDAFFEPNRTNSEKKLIAFLCENSNSALREILEIDNSIPIKDAVEQYVDSDKTPLASTSTLPSVPATMRQK
jgi:hypothetical protein